MDVPPLIQEPVPAPPHPPRMSLAARLLNVFAVPGQVFNDVRSSPPTVSNWLVPSVLGAIVGALAAVIIFSQPSIQQQFQKENQRIQEAVTAGKLTPDLANVLEKITAPTSMKVFGAIVAALGSFAGVFWWGFVLWLLAHRMLRVNVPFSKALEVAGLAMLVDVLGTVVGMLLIVHLGRIGATPSLALVIKDFDVTRKGHLLAAAANIFAFWVVGVRSIGLAKLAGVPYLRAAWLVVTFWVIQQSLLVVTGIAQLAR
ncbi:MAG TPA: YIP1 family protein [Verrucomicrobiae bacterium]|nr:YIP1 family protein [Verrucomicrobiae bacterium]